MGLLSTLITLPLAPVRAAIWAVEQVAEEVDREMYDETRIRGQLVQLELDHEERRVDDQERAVIEDELLERLAVARHRSGGETVAVREHRTEEPGDG